MLVEVSWVDCMVRFDGPHGIVVVVVVVVDPKLLSSSLLYGQCQADEGTCLLQLV